MLLNRFIEALRVLSRNGVDFVVVGGVAACARGAVYNTRDLDVVHSREPENVARILTALRELNARYFYRQDFQPNESHLSSPGHQLLLTDLGRVDFLGQIGPNWDYPGLLPHSSDVQFAEDVIVRVLDLETVIAAKEAAGAEKDLVVLPMLRRTLQESRKLQNPANTTPK
jgi:hypothetical protein